MKHLTFIGSLLLLCVMWLSPTAQAKHKSLHHKHPTHRTTHVRHEFAQTKHGDAFIPSATPVDCLVDVIVHEAGAATMADKYESAKIVMKRQHDARYPSSVCDIVHQKVVVHHRVRYQFPWFGNRALRPIRSRHQFEALRPIAQMVFDEYRDRDPGPAEFINTPCRWDPSKYRLVARHDQCYLAEITRPRRRRF